MKTVITLLFLLHALTVCGQVPEMEVKDSTFLRAIDIFLDSLESRDLQSKQFVIGAMIRKLEVIPRPIEEVSETMEYSRSNFKWSYELVLRAQTEHMVFDGLVASCKFSYRGREVYMFFGGEYFVKYLDRDRKKLERSEPRGWDGGRIIIAYLICKIKWEKIDVVLFTR